MGELILIISQLYTFVLLGRVLASWAQLDPYSPLYRTLHDLTEPVLAPIRNNMPPMGMFDFSPIIAIIGIQILGGIVAQIFTNLGL